MLEIKNVTKVYNAKGGAQTKALDNVSVSFADTGLVFLLGKSGSGKSTLLNVCGGLDEPTSGEIIVKGKSSKSFSGSDFDSYRNTFVGFVFQEYNILDEFNVEDNIALALELQGKPKDREKINSLLKEVELEQFAKRKPNTLSGGQKQRIAIARALVKDPQIIMADEPTGALDSATGKQVFDTLKKLSETRLVIVVSHDREFAEIYGDRIVELKDGQIISDVSKKNVPPKNICDNVSLIGGNILAVKNGASLTEENFKEIKKFIQSSEKEVLISNGQREIEAFGKANNINADGGMHTFENTDSGEVQIKSYTAEESKFIRSKLPASKAIKIGASSLKLKPFRLVLTIFLSMIAFIMFGLLSTLMVYDGDSVSAKSFAQSEYRYLNIKKQYRVVTDYDYEYGRSVKFTQEELDRFVKDYGNEVVGYYGQDYNGGISISNLGADSKSSYYKGSIDKFIYFPEGHSARANIKGTYPVAENEICISSYLFDVLKNTGVYEVSPDGNGSAVSSGNKKLTLNTAEDIIGKYIAVNFGGDKAFRVTGVFDSGVIPEKYDTLKQNSSDYSLIYTFETYLQDEMHQAVCISGKFYEAYGSYLESSNGSYVQYFDYIENVLSFGGRFAEFENGEIKREDTNAFISVQTAKAYSAGLPTKVIFFDGRESRELSDNEVILNIDSLIKNDNSPLICALTEKYYNAIIAGEEFENLGGWKYNGNNSEAFENARYLTRALQEKYLNCVYDYDNNLTNAQKLEILEEVVKELEGIPPQTVKLTIDTYNTLDMSVAGYYIIPDIYSVTNWNGVYLTQNFINGHITVYENNYSETTNYKPEKGTIYSGILVPYDGTAERYKDVSVILGMDNRLENDVFYTVGNSLAETIEKVNDIADTLSTVFLWVGIVLAVFSALLLFNFISVSISNKRKEIGILRAVGARGVDVFKIFFAESGIIVGICLVLALIGSFAVCAVLNSVLKSELGLNVALFVFGFASVGMLLAIAVTVAFVSTFLPVYFASRKKPVDSIRAL